MDGSGGAPEPRLELRQLSLKRDARLKIWKVTWAVRNLGAERLRILRARLPHGQFKSDEQLFEPAIDLEPDKESRLQTLVRCDEPPGPVTENAFVIFYVSWRDEPWRVFVRIRVTVGSDGKPQTATESITTQKVGFAEKDFS